MRSVSLLAGGKTKELAALFSNQSEVAEPLQRLVESLWESYKHPRSGDCSICAAQAHFN